MPSIKSSKQFVLLINIALRIMSRITQKGQNIPVLGCSRAADYTHADFSKDLQVYHLTSKHHPNQLYDNISTNFVHGIQLQENPSTVYNHQMKNLYMDQLESTLNQYKNKKLKMNEEAQDFRKDYKENVNSMILCMEKEDRKRQLALKNCMRVQEERRNRFIDADLARNQKIEEFIKTSDYTTSLQMARSQLLEERARKLSNQDSRGLNYDQIAKQNRQSSINLPQMPQKQKSTSEAQYRNNQVNSLHTNNFPVARKCDNTLRILRVHNPITNPIEYHIDNPYFINKMQRKYQNS